MSRFVDGVAPAGYTGSGPEGALVDPELVHEDRLNPNPVPPSQFHLKANQFPLKANQFPLKANQFPLKANQFPLKANQFHLKANQFPLIKLSTNCLIRRHFHRWHSS
jgi:hypothetical protein